MYSTAPATSLFSLGRVSPAITAHQWGQANQVPASHSCIWSAGVFQGIGGKPKGLGIGVMGVGGDGVTEEGGGGYLGSGFHKPKHPLEMAN